MIDQSTYECRRVANEKKLFTLAKVDMSNRRSAEAVKKVSEPICLSGLRRTELLR
jgi:hypothetical protein